jgi:hypothetical protein
MTRAINNQARLRSNSVRSLILSQGKGWHS